MSLTLLIVCARRLCVGLGRWRHPRAGVAGVVAVVLGLVSVPVSAIAAPSARVGAASLASPRGATSMRLASGSELGLSQAPVGLRSAVRRTLGADTGPPAAAFPPITLTAPGTTSFGLSVAISGSTAVVGSAGPGSGAAYVFVRSGPSWTRQATLT